MHIQKKGSAYKVYVSVGYDGKKHKFRTSTFRPPKGLTPTQIKRAVLEFAEAFERKVKGGANVKYLNMTFKSFCTEVYYKNHLNNLKPKTASGYKIVIENRLIPYFGAMQIKNIRPLDIRGWLANLERRDGKDEKLSRNTSGSWFRTLSAVLGKAYEWEIIDENPCRRIKSPAKTHSDVNALQLEDVRKIITKLPEYHDMRAKMFILLVLNTGIREGEAAGLEWRDIDYDKHLISITRTSQYIPGTGMIESTPKSDSSVRTIPITENLITEFKLYREWQDKEIEKLGEFYQGNPGDEARLFTTWEGLPVFDSTFRSWLNKFLEWCEVPHVTVHGLRHTFASILIANGTDPRTAAALLGQSSPALVMNVYANPQNEAKTRAINNLNYIYNSKD